MDSLQAKVDALQSLVQYRISGSIRTGSVEDVEKEILAMAKSIRDYKTPPRDESDTKED